MADPLKTLVIGAGNRGYSWMTNAKKAGAKFKPIAIAEPNAEKRIAYFNEYVGMVNMFSSGKEAIEDGYNYDAVIIATPDRTHRDLAVQALEKGYNVLLEKPMATTHEDCHAIVHAQEQSGSVLSIGHVLRYAPFFEKIKYITKKEKLGKLLSINLRENVGHWHFPHSYVRGNWRTQEESGPVLLTKSCHDMDIMRWLADSPPKSTVSMGGLNYFNPENKPKGAGSNCFDCKCTLEDCLYKTPEKYIKGDHLLRDDGSVKHPYNVLSRETDPAVREKALRGSPYSECVFNGQNNVLDNQDVLIEFKNGVRGNFSLNWGGEFATRDIHVRYSRGEIKGDLDKGELTITEYVGIRGKGKTRKKVFKSKGGHGGGDGKLIKNFERLIRTGDPSLNKTSARESLDSHLMVFAAEYSREIGKVVNF